MALRFGLSFPLVAALAFRAGFAAPGLTGLGTAFSVGEEVVFAGVAPFREGSSAFLGAIWAVSSGPAGDGVTCAAGTTGFFIAGDDKAGAACFVPAFMGTLSGAGAGAALVACLAGFLTSDALLAARFAAAIGLGATCFVDAFLEALASKVLLREVTEVLTAEVLGSLALMSRTGVGARIFVAKGFAVTFVAAGAGAALVGGMSVPFSPESLLEADFATLIRLDSAFFLPTGVAGAFFSAGAGAAVN